MMISLLDIYHVIAAIIPLYVAMAAAYLSMKLWKIFTPDQCAGINKFVANFSIPLLSFQVISSSNPYKMNMRLVLADFLQKLFVIIILSPIVKIRRSEESLRWVITGLSLSTLPNTLILGIPMMRAMYGEEAEPLLAQIIVLQSIVWYNLLLVLFEIEATGVHRNMRSLLSTVGKKVVQNPNTFATVAGLIWASIHFRWEVKMPKVIENSIEILSKGGLGMAMFSLGLFMASQSRLIACGARKAVLAMVMKFVVGPLIMVVASFTLGLKGTLFKLAVAQAALPQGIVPFVFAKEYGVHPEIMSTGVIFGLLVAVPIGLVYYLLLGL